MHDIIPDDDGKIHVRLSRVQKSNLSAIIYNAEKAFASSSITTLDDVTYENSMYVFSLPDELSNGSAYLMDIYNNDEFIQGYRIVTQSKPEPLTEAEVAEIDYTLSQKQELVTSLLSELDQLIAQGYYYHESISIPTHIMEDIESLSHKLHELHEHHEGDVAHDSYLLRHELSLLKSMISRENETMRRLNMRTKTVPLTKKDVNEITTSISAMIADVLNKKLEN